MLYVCENCRTLSYEADVLEFDYYCPVCGKIPSSDVKAYFTLQEAMQDNLNEGPVLQLTLGGYPYILEGSGDGSISLTRCFTECSSCEDYSDCYYWQEYGTKGKDCERGVCNKDGVPISNTYDFKGRIFRQDYPELTDRECKLLSELVSLPSTTSSENPTEGRIRTAEQIKSILIDVIGFRWCGDWWDMISYCEQDNELRVRSPDGEEHILEVEDLAGEPVKFYKAVEIAE